MSQNPNSSGSMPPSNSGGASQYTGPAPDKDAITLGMLCHLLAIFTGFVGPLIIWLVKKDQHPFIDDQGKESLNFQITMAIATACCFIFLCLWWLPFVVVQAVRIAFSIVGTIKSNEGIAYRYPLTLRLIK